MTLQKRNDAMVNLLRADFQGRYEPQFALANAQSLFTSLPGLRGLWFMSGTDSSGDVYDISGVGKTLTNNNTVTFDNDSLVPYGQFVIANSEYLERTDEADLDISGTEAFIVNNGLTLGGWFYHDIVGANSQGYLAKWGDIGNFAYLLIKNTVDQVRFGMSDDGTNVDNVFSAAITANVWRFSVGRFIPSSEVAVFVNNIKTTAVTARASIFNSSANFRIGSTHAATPRLLDGRAAFCFLCASALPDFMISNLFHQTKAMFNVT